MQHHAVRQLLKLPYAILEVHTCLWPVIEREIGRWPVGERAGAGLMARPAAAGASSAFGCTHPGCQKSFGRRSNLEAHVRVAHGGERHVCPHPGCGKALRHKSRLKSHLALHAAHAGAEHELRKPYPKPARARPDDARLRAALAECRKRELALGARATCPGCGRGFASQGFGPHLALCARAHAAVLADEGLCAPSAPAAAGGAGAEARASLFAPLDDGDDEPP